MACLTDEELHEIVRGALPAEASDRHLDDCAECSERLARLASAFDPSILSPGARAGAYRVDHLVAARPGAVLYAATGGELGRRVLLEVFRDPVPDPEERARRIEEARTAAVSHTSIPRIFDAGAFEDRIFLARERVHGTLVPQWIALHPRHWREVAGVYRRAGEGLELAHSAGLVRTDAGATSILIDGTGRVVLRGSLARGTAEEIAADREAFRAGFRESLAGLATPGWLTRALAPGTPSPSLRPMLRRLAREGRRSRAGRAAAMAAACLGVLLLGRLVVPGPARPTPTPLPAATPEIALATTGAGLVIASGGDAAVSGTGGAPALP